MKNKDEIISIIREDVWMMEILQSVKTLNLPDWWICAGFVRSKVPFKALLFARFKSIFHKVEEELIYL